MTAIHELMVLSAFTPLISSQCWRQPFEAHWEWEEALLRLGLWPVAHDLARVRKSSAFGARLEWLQSSATSLSIRGDANYPKDLLAWPDAPLVLWYRGAPAWQGFLFLGVVGSRHPQPESIDWMNWQLRAFLRQHKIGIVSGGARGIDQRSHLLAVESERPTLALMPVGLSQRYPPTFKLYEEEILAKGGAVVSPFPLDQPLYRGNFYYRNLVIAALTPLVLVVEARRKSGTMITAKAALELGKAVATLPAFPGQVGGMGNLDLLVDGAIMIRDVQDLMVAWSRTVGPAHGPPGQIGEDQIDSPDSDGRREDLIARQTFSRNR